MASKNKVCPQCKLEKDRATKFSNYFCKKRQRTITKSWCKVCTTRRQKERYHTVPGVKESAIVRHRGYRKSQEYKEQFKVWRSKWRKKTVENLDDSYLKERVKRRGEEVTPENLDKARTSILIHRIKKKLRDG